MADAIELGSYPGTFFCVRCDRNRWFSAHRARRPAPGGLNPTCEQLAAMQRREHDHGPRSRLTPSSRQRATPTAAAVIGRNSNP